MKHKWKMLAEFAPIFTEEYEIATDYQQLCFTRKCAVGTLVHKCSNITIERLKLWCKVWPGQLFSIRCHSCSMVPNLDQWVWLIFIWFCSSRALHWKWYDRKSGQRVRVWKRCSKWPKDRSWTWTGCTRTVCFVHGGACSPQWAICSYSNPTISLISLIP